MEHVEAAEAGADHHRVEIRPFLPPRVDERVLAQTVIARQPRLRGIGRSMIGPEDGI
jgi:hypothetical protein